MSSSRRTLLAHVAAASVVVAVMSILLSSRNTIGPSSYRAIHGRPGSHRTGKAPRPVRWLARACADRSASAISGGASCLVITSVPNGLISELASSPDKGQLSGGGLEWSSAIRTVPGAVSSRRR
ncbi:MAG TPA: hypothetical protein VMV07_27815 [Streptosporangiaceae bacterium]|nr:hypothetical protein [Streptosporangiaceae bacterium]